MPEKRSQPKPEHQLLFEVLKKYRFLLIGLFVFEGLSSLFGLLIPYLTKLQIDVLQFQYTGFFAKLSTSPWRLLVLFGVLVAITNLAGRLLLIASQVTTTRLTYKLGRGIEKRLYERLRTFDAGFLQNPRNRRIVMSIFDVTTLGYNLIWLGRQALSSSILVLGLLPIVAAIDWRIFGIAFVASLAQGWLLTKKTKLDNAHRLLQEQTTSKYSELRWLLHGNFQSIMNAGGTERILEEFFQLSKRRFRTELQKEKIRHFFSIGDWLTENFTLICITLLAGSQVLQGNMTIGTFTMITLYGSQIQASFQQIFSVTEDWNQIRMVLIRLGFFLRMKPRFSLDRIEQITAPIDGDIQVDRVTFRYPSLADDEKTYLAYLIKKIGKLSEKTWMIAYDKKELREWEEMLAEQSKPFPRVLNEVTCRFARGELTALVGRNGSGKTTLVNLLLRNYDPEHGQLTLGSAEMGTIHPSDLHRYVSIISQTPFVMDSFSVKDNVTLGANRDVSDQEIWQALEQVDLKLTIEKLPKKLESLVGDEMRLSGGQFQLLVIARVLLQKRPFIFLDEGTNQLDAEHELRIVQALQTLKQNAAIILITHRMTTARKADQIYVMDQGAIVQSGTHTSLLQESEGLYKKFWDLQVVQ